MRSKFRCEMIVIVLAAVLLAGCGGAPDPLNDIRTALAGVTDYSVILADMKEEGNFFKTYYHKFRVLMDTENTETGWLEVAEKRYRRYMPFLGMTIWTKADGKDGESIGPPGYEYVGNRRYGEWRRDSSGGSFWAFYGQYRLMSDLLGGGPIYRRDYDRYRTFRTQRKPFFGSQNQYGTGGTYTRSRKPDFFARQQARTSTRKASFSDKVNNRIGRTRTSVRGRSSVRGK